MNFNYEQGRLHVADGFIVFFKATKLAHRLVTMVTGGSYSHCGILTWMESHGVKRLMLIEAFMGGTRIVNLRSYSKREMLVMDLGIDWGLQGEALFQKTGHNPYGLMDFLSIGVKDLTTKVGMPVRMPNFKGEVCSELVANYLISSGFGIQDSCISPNTLIELINDNQWSCNQFSIS